MFCKNCGNQLDANAKFCVNCGTPANQPQADQPASTSPSPQSASPTLPATPSSTVATVVQATEKLPGFATIFKVAWQNFTSKFWILLLLQFLSVLPIFTIVVLGVIVAAVAGPNFDNTVIILGLFAIGSAAIIAILYWMVWIQAATIQFLLYESPKTIKETLKEVKPKLLNFFLASLFYGGTILLGFILLIIPGIIAATFFAFSSVIAIAENKSAIQSMKASREYVRGRFGQVFGRNFLFGLIYFVVFIGIGIVDAVIASALNFGEVQILSNILSFIIAPFVFAFIVALYTHLHQLNGSQTVQTKGSRWYVVLAIIGALLIPIMLLASVALLALNSARVKSRDAKRVTDVRQIATGLELYYAQTGRYPVNLSALTPKYLQEVPVAPTPQDGECSDIENTYRYSYLSADEYALTFCLGFETGNIGAGKHSLTPKGIDEKK